MGKEREFAERAIAPAGTLDVRGLANAASDNIEAIYTFLSRTLYSDSVDELRRGMTAFERWCDNLIIETIRPLKAEYFSMDPMVAYIIAGITEIRMVKLILSAKVNGLSMDMILERLRETYV